ncbi:hypothetical protein PHYSODRAFT_264669 [Phytophthora sojae]|uniref:tRNA/rRNA methyltransferase SpoU type domain-containing protein n=1 Tax=Phytophthora sojae (strain P6497) TaxID=1094619 RepID=G4ZZ48_PHYSP|nr:hypothetical protein PHYSODRAFT_264669 [Phytophthora sojae]EGZ11070.1 hypothetical protein PHYSODRAFT_264669 [Phytophthora sojae]|eukprot:XP_009533815.1 hypothetical protein PHYSODRAFT_264669 [Phytophthora sojae]
MSTSSSEAQQAEPLTTADTQLGEAPEHLRRAETVLRHRTSRIVLVLEQCMDSHNHQAVLRTAEALGVQHVWLIAANAQQLKTHDDTGKSKKPKKSSGKKITKNCAGWLTVREFSSIADCLTALR